MVDVQNREIWARGLTLSYAGKRITVGDQTYLVRAVRPLSDVIEVDVVTSLRLDPRTLVTVHDG